VDGNDLFDITAARFFLMAAIIHETAHWIAANVRLLHHSYQSCSLTFSAAPRLQAGHRTATVEDIPDP
jgi:hypothetical protein